jgi:hypothetical protein
MTVQSSGTQSDAGTHLKRRGAFLADGVRSGTSGHRRLIGMDWRSK